MPVVTLPRRYSIKPSLSVGINWGHPLTRNLFGCWLMNEGGGLSVYNLAFPGQDTGPLTNMTPADWVATVGGPGLNWSAANSYITLRTGPIIHTLPNVSVEALVIPDSVAAGYREVYCEAGVMGSRLQFRQDTNVFNFYIYRTPSWQGGGSSITVSVGQLCHIVGTLSSTNGMALYLNGVLDGIDAAHTLPGTDTMNRSYIGCEYGIANCWVGKILFVRLWNRALNWDEVRQLYIDPYCFLTPRKLHIEYSAGGTAWTLSLSDSVAIVDSISKAMGVARSETIGLADIIAKGMGIAKTENIGVVDAISKGPSLKKTDSIGITESLAKSIGVRKTDTVSLSDSQAKALGVARVDTVVVTDAVAKAIGLVPISSHTLDLGVVASGDDCYAYPWGGGAINLEAYYGFMGDYSSGIYDYSVGVRFQNVTIPKGANIIAAFLSLKAYSLTGTIPDTFIEGDDEDNCLAFSTASDYYARPRTSANVTWTPGAWIGGTWYNSADITSIIQEIVDQALWVSGNALALFWRDASGWGGAQKWFASYLWNYTGNLSGPRLHIEYTIKGDSVAITDNISKAIGVTKSDSVSLSDKSAKTIGVTRADTVTVTDAVSKGVGMTRADTIGITDAISKSIGLVRAETIAIVDSFHFFTARTKQTWTLIAKLGNRIPWQKRR